MKARNTIARRRLGIALVVLGLVWVGSALGLGLIASAFLEHRVPSLIYKAVVRFGGEQEAMPLAYAWSLRLGILLAMLWCSATVIGFALWKKLAARKGL